MATMDESTYKETLESLRNIRRKLNSIPDSEIDKMSEEDQEKYSDSLDETSLAILNLETAQLSGVNKSFKEKEPALKAAAAKIEKNSAHLKDSVKFIHVVSDELKLISNIINLIG